jgi:hypothetical protein
MTSALLVLVAGCASELDERPRLQFSTVSVSISEMAVGAVALAEFEPARDAVLEGGECRRSPLRQDGGERLGAYFPSRADPETLITMMVNADGEGLQYQEIRGVPKPRKSIQEMEAQTRNMVRTHVQLDYMTGKASVKNTVPGEVGRGVFGTVADFESSPVLGDLRARADLVRRVCDAPVVESLIEGT